MLPRVTVLTTLFNKGAFVEEAVRSVLASTFEDFELLIVNDASTDDGPERVSRFRDPRIRWVDNPHNLGRAGAAERGMQEAMGAYVAVLDADDLMHPERIAKQVAFLDANPEVGICGTYARTAGDRSHVAAWPVTDEEARGVMLFQDPLLYGTAMLRRSVVLASGIHYPVHWKEPGMDLLFLHRLAQHTRMATLPEALTTYRLGAHNFRAGRDPITVRTNIHREVFRLYGLDASEEELELHVLLEQHYRRLPNSATVRALHAWVERLRAFNRTHGHFPAQVFDRRLNEDWMRWYYVLADKRLWPALAHLILEGGQRGTRAAYWFKVRWRQVFGPNGS